MSKIQQWVALTLLGVLAAFAGGWFLLISPKKADAAKVRTEKTSVQSQVAQLQSQLSVLKAQAADLPKRQARLAQIRHQMPETPELPALVRNLAAAADSAGVDLVSLTPSVPAPVNVVGS